MAGHGSAWVASTKQSKWFGRTGSLAVVNGILSAPIPIANVRPFGSRTAPINSEAATLGGVKWPMDRNFRPDMTSPLQRLKRYGRGLEGQIGQD